MPPYRYQLLWCCGAVVSTDEGGALLLCYWALVVLGAWDLGAPLAQNLIEFLQNSRNRDCLRLK